jgi:hypothetical protein
MICALLSSWYGIMSDFLDAPPEIAAVTAIDKYLDRVI